MKNIGSVVTLALIYAICIVPSVQAQATGANVLPPGTQSDFRTFTPGANGGPPTLVVPTQAMGMDFNQFREMTCPNPCSMTAEQLQGNFAALAAYRPAGTNGIYDPGVGDPGAIDGGDEEGGGGSTTGCASLASSGPLASMFGNNLTKAMTDQLVANGVIPARFAAILSDPNSTAAMVATALQEMERLGIPTNPLDLAREQLPILGTVVDGVVRGDIMGVAIQQAAARGLPPEAVAALNLARTQALANNGQLTQVARDALRIAGLPYTVGGLATEFGVSLEIPPEVSRLANVDNLLPSEIREIEEALTIVAGLEGLGDGDVTAEDMQKALDSLNTLGQQLGLGNLTPDEARELISGLNDLAGAAEKEDDGDGDPNTASDGSADDAISAQDIDEFLSAVGADSAFSAIGGGNLSAETISNIYGDLSELNDLTGGRANVIFDNLAPMQYAFTSLPGGASPNKIMDAFQELSRLSGGSSSTQTVGALLNATSAIPPAQMKALLGDDYAKTINSLKSLNGIQNMNLTSVSGAFAAAQRVMSSGILSDTAMNKISDAFKSLSEKFKAPQFLAKFKNLSKVKDSLAKFSKIKGLSGKKLSDLKGFSNKLKSLDIIKKFGGLDKYSKAIKAPDFIKKYNDFGADRMKEALKKIKDFGPAQLKKLFEKMPPIPIDRLNSLLVGGRDKMMAALNKIPGMDKIPGGAQAVIGVLGGLSFSSAGCLFSSIANKILCRDGPTPKPCVGNGPPNAASGGGQDDTYKNYCFSGPLQPRPVLESPEDATSVEPDFDKGADGAKSKECFLHKNTETRTILSMNDNWLLLEHDLDGPELKNAVVEGQSPYYKDAENEHKIKGALVGGRGGVYSTTFNQKALAAGVKCDQIEPDCPGFPSKIFLPREEQAQLARLDYDACTNKYLFNLMMGRGTQHDGGTGKASTEGMNFIFDPRAVRGEASYDQTWCQPFKMVPVQCEPDLMSLSGFLNGVRNAVGDIAGDIAGSVVDTQFNRATGGRGGVFGDMAGDFASDYASDQARNSIGGNTSPAGGACKKKTCERPNCNRSDVNKYDYEAWRYLARGWFSVLDTTYFPTRVPELPKAKDYDALKKLREDQNKGPGRGRFGGFDDADWAILGDGMAKDSWGDVDVQINGLIKHPYERIWDPTHPFSPRYDYNYNERDMYSPMAASYFEFSACEVRCAAVKVDLMSFRHPQFSKCMGCRLGVNTACFWVEVAAQTICPGPCIPLPAAIANSRKGKSPVPVCATPLKIAKKWPPCNTKFDVNGGKDNVPPMCYGCVLASGDPNPYGGVKKCCSDLAKPIAPINTLKIRSKGDVSRKPPEGYEFSKYFGDHKPYMRWWDTGGEAGSPGSHDQMSKCGEQDVLVGVGTEKTGCNYGGGDGQKAACIQVPKTDPLTSWMELKLYQTNSFRTYRLNCLAQYEKLFKAGGSEDFVLKMPKYAEPVDNMGGTKLTLWPEPWRGYVEDKSDDKRFPKSGSAAGYANAISAPYGNLPRGLDNAKVGDILIWDKKVNASRMPHVAVVVSVANKASNPEISDKEQFIAVRSMNTGKYPDVCGNTDSWGMDGLRYLHKNCIVADGKKRLKSSGEDPLGEEDSFYEPFLKAGTGHDGPNGGGKCFTAKKGDFSLRYTFSCEDNNLQTCEEKDWNKVIIYRPCANGTNNDCRD